MVINLLNDRGIEAVPATPKRLHHPAVVPERFRSMA
jgi:hypothetical protein